MMKQSALRVLEIEQRAIAQLAQYIDDNFVKACQLILPCKGKIIVCGMGKSGHIGHKISATLSSYYRFKYLQPFGCFGYARSYCTRRRR